MHFDSRFHGYGTLIHSIQFHKNSWIVQEIRLLPHTRIKIDDEEFKITDLEKVPENYRVNLQPTSRPPDASGLASLQKPNMPNPPTRTKRIKIKMTKTGLTFSGPSAYLSHMHRCSFVFNKVPYSSVEQGYHHLHAEFEGEHEIAKAIMNVHDAYGIKDLADQLPKSEAWAKVSPGKMWDLNEAKSEQNLDLKKQLLETAPALLIEASVDSAWGGGLAPSVPTYTSRASYPGQTDAAHNLRSTETICDPLCENQPCARGI